MVYNYDFEITQVNNEGIIVTSGAHLTISGIANCTIRLLSGSTCDLRGIHNGNIIVDSDCSFIIHGTFSGDIENNGSTKIYGIAKIKHFSGNPIFVYKNAIINEKTYSADAYFDQL